MELIRLSTAGSVDDGKSTLIGRLLFEMGAVPGDTLKAVEKASQKKGASGTDLSLLVDGLMAEREQNITIDVAHMYFNSLRRKYIVADSPGHWEYTRNMITAASNADVFIILVDVTKGISDQTYRHLYIATMLRIQKVIVCINKMDLVGYDQAIFENLKNNMHAHLSVLHSVSTSVFIPTSALLGDNVVGRSALTPWYPGPSLFETIETTELLLPNLPFRFRIQNVLSSKDEQQKIFAGKVISGKMNVGNTVTILPSNIKAKLRALMRGKKNVKEVAISESISVEFEGDVDARRGDVVVAEGEEPVLKDKIAVELCWFDEIAGRDGFNYIMQYGASRVKAQLFLPQGQRNLKTLKFDPPCGQLKMNEVTEGVMILESPVTLDAFSLNRSNGTFILVDESSNNTVGVGFIR